MRVHLESDALSSVGRAGHHGALGALLGGNLFARFAMHPAVAELSDPRERGKLVNAAWRRYGVVNSLSLLSLAVAYAPARFGEARLTCCRSASTGSSAARTSRWRRCS